MIENDEQLQQAHEALGDLYRLLASYRSRIRPLNVRNYTVLAQGPLEEIRKIQTDIDDYLGLKEPPVIVEEHDATNQTALLREAPPRSG